jgi:hypothetical protein
MNAPLQLLFTIYSKRKQYAGNVIRDTDNRINRDPDPRCSGSAFQGKWQGTVAVFDLIRHPKAKRCYAWQYRDGFEWKSVAVLEIPPVYSPQTAVKVAIASKGRRQWRNGQK